MSICSWFFFCNLYLIQLVYFFIMSGACTITTAADGRNLWATRVLSISQHCSHYTTVSRQIGRGGGCKAKWNRQSRVRKIVTSARSVSAAAALEETAVLDAYATRASRVSVVDASIPRSAAATADKKLAGVVFATSRRSATILALAGRRNCHVNGLTDIAHSPTKNKRRRLIALSCRRKNYSHRFWLSPTVT